MNDDVRLESIDSPKNDLAIFNDATLESVQESERHVVDSDDVCIMRDFTDVDSDPNSIPRMDKVNDPEVARLRGATLDNE